MSKNDAPSLSLEECVQTLKQHLSGAPQALPKEAARLYFAVVGFLCHLKSDQAVVYQASKSSKSQEGPVPCPPPKEIPAITAVLEDSQLFHALLACLKVPDATESTADMPRPGRKRAYSFGSDADYTMASKLMKVQHSSPVPPMKKAVSARSVEPKHEVPRLPIPVLAATILYSAFQHVDHWPAPLVQAYAEDSFGPRLWVDDERCSLLVQNLALVHMELEKMEATDASTLTQAARVAQYYEKLPLDKPMNAGAAKPQKSTFAPNPQNRLRSMSMDSIGQGSAAGPPSDSDSGDEEECIVEVSSGRLAKAGDGASDGSSSSSGEEDEEVVVVNNSLGQVTSSRIVTLESQATTPTPNPLASSYPGRPTFLNLQRVRRRYVGVNLDHAHEAIAKALSDRLELKSKQNSKLLLALPSFVCIPAVRRLSTRQLERWLQSPALSGQARALFATTVQHMHNVDPPLPDDVQAIDHILGMKLKANQLNMHIENVTKIAERIPNVTVCRQIFIHALRDEVVVMENGTRTSALSEPMQMIRAVYGTVPRSLACEGLAMALLTLLAEPGTNENVQRERRKRAKRTRSLIRSVASTLGSNFDGCGLIESLLSFDVNAQSWSLEDEEDKARLLYECATLLVPAPSKEESRRQRKGQQRQLSEEESARLRSKLKRVRKLLLDWCCNEYAPRWRTTKDRQSGTENKSLKRKRTESPSVGAGSPDYSSVLDDQEVSVEGPKCLDLIRCVLFAADAESSVLREFLYPGEPAEVTNQASNEDEDRIQQCCEYGADLDDDMLRIILKSATLSNEGIDPSLAIPLVELLFQCCNKDRTATLNFNDPELVWELYRLVEYLPSSPRSSLNGTQDFATVTNGTKAENGSSGVQNGLHIPRLAYPGLWWRVTCLALVMCGASPERIGKEMWRSHPTLQALMKMATSGRYRFPTVDYDEEKRNEVKAAESRMRDEETLIAEQLFLPPPPKATKPEERDNGIVSGHTGSRASARQREKQERLRRQQREKEAALVLAEANRRKKLLRTAQKSIMLWDPRGPARKPTKDSVSLILSTERLFGLSEAFQQTVSPDFLLMTIGEKTRGAIERAFDWVIPIISSLPEIIARLPASASCFLLLRAYGEGSGDKFELRKLSAPLLDHVRKSLTGEFGETDAVRAADLLLTDLADTNPDRRRCARRVMRETLVGQEPVNSDTTLLSLLQVPHSRAIVSDAIGFISRSLEFERGSVLRSLVVALNQFISFAAENKIEGPWNFASILCELISSRYIVCAEAMDRFPDFRSLAISVVDAEFRKCIHSGKEGTNDVNAEDLVLMRLCDSTGTEDTSPRKEVTIRLPLLQAMCVLLSIWKDDNLEAEVTARTAIQGWADALMYPYDHMETELETLDGAAGAAMSSGGRAMAIEQWVLLAKARSDFIARRAALSAPTSFLPRLLLCSGLPTASLLTMVDRLGKRGDKAEDHDRVFRDLLMPSVTNEWGPLHTRNRRSLSRKLAGRLSAYLRLNKTPIDNNLSMSFLEWLSEECYSSPSPKKTGRPAKKSGRTQFGTLLTKSSSGFVASEVGKLEPSLADHETPNIEGTPIALAALTNSSALNGDFRIADVPDKNSLVAYVEKCFVENRPDILEAWLEATFRNEIPSTSCAGVEAKSSAVDGITVCIALLKTLFESSLAQENALTALVLKWVPSLSEARGTSVLWSLLFSSHPKSLLVADLLRHRVALLWCKTHVIDCQQFLLSNYSGLFVPSIIRFLIVTSGQPAVFIQTFVSSTTRSEDFWGSSESGLSDGVSIALLGAQEHQSDSAINASTNLPDWIVLLLLLSRPSKQSTRRVCDLLLKATSKVDNDVRKRIRSAVLRLYTLHPKNMKLGDPSLRALLVEGAKSVPWLSWRSALDPQLDDMLFSLQASPSQRLVQGLVDLAKSHPLLVLRKVPSMVQLLDDDASIVSMTSNGRGRTHGENILGPIVAKLSGKPVKVVVRHWGYSFTETLWVSLLDVLLSIPKEVLFGSGSFMSLEKLLGVYAKLLFIQCQLQSNPARVKNKFAEFLNAFKSSDAKGWEAWLDLPEPSLPSLGSMRNILMSCSLIAPTKDVERLQKMIANS